MVDEVDAVDEDLVGEGQVQGQLDQAVHDAHPLFQVGLVFPQVGQVGALGVGALPVPGQESLVRLLQVLGLAERGLMLGQDALQVYTVFYKAVGRHGSRIVRIYYLSLTIFRK